MKQIFLDLFKNYMRMNYNKLKSTIFKKYFFENIKFYYNSLVISKSFSFI